MPLRLNFSDKLIALIVDPNVWKALIGGFISGQKILDGLLTIFVIDDFKIS